MATHTLPFTKIFKKDVHLAGGKGASLGEMTQAGILAPPGKFGKFFGCVNYLPTAALSSRSLASGRVSASHDTIAIYHFPI